MIEPKLYITEDLNNGTIVRIDDTTGSQTTENPGGYGGSNTSINAISKTRFLFSSYLTESVTTSVTTCLSGREYEVTGSGANTVVVDIKTFVLGDKFVLMVDATPVIGSGLSLIETGRFAYTPSFLPSDIYATYVPSFFGIDSLTFPDSTYFATYELYSTIYPAGSSPAGKYIVMGTTGTTTISGVVYNAGEVFTQTSGFSHTGNDIAAFEAEETYCFPLYYNAWQAKIKISLKYANTCNCDPTLAQKLMEIENRLAAVQYNFQNNLNSDYSGTQTLLSQIIEISNQ